MTILRAQRLVGTAASAHIETATMYKQFHLKYCATHPVMLVVRIDIREQHGGKEQIVIVVDTDDEVSVKYKLRQVIHQLRKG
jgi:hypothetical protein